LARQYHNGIHLVVRHYNPGGETTDGFDSYLHYYIETDGKSFLSKKVSNEGKSIADSLHELSKKAKKTLAPDPHKAITVGSNTDGDNTPKVLTLTLGKGELHLKGYDGLMDYGFKLIFITGNQIMADEDIKNLS
jgi:hypothetical protein